MIIQVCRSSSLTPDLRAMRYAVHPAPIGLEGVVRSCWTLESDALGDTPNRLAAETCPNLVVIRSGSFTEGDGRPSPRVHMAGPLSRPMDMVAHGPFRIFGLYLWPWGLKALFELESVVCIDRILDVVNLIGGDLTPTIPDLLTMNDPRSTGNVLAQLLPLRAIERDDVLEGIIRGLLEATVIPEVSSLVLESGLARRQFERRFKALTGFSPGLFLRILRFQRCFRMLEGGGATSLTEVAYGAGYFDQSHFIRDFKRFSGMNPRRYFLQMPDKADNFVRLA